MRTSGISRSGVGLWCAVVWCLAAVPAMAQQPNGVKAGEGRIHPYFDLEQRFDSAAIYYDPNRVGPRLGAEFITHLRPGIRVDVPGAQVLFNLNAFADYVWYNGLLTTDSHIVSHLQAGAELDAEFNRTGNVGFRIADRFTRSDRSQNPAVGIGFLSLYNQVEAGIPIHPGGGALEITPGGSFTFEFFDPIANNDIPNCPPGPPCDFATVARLNYTDVGAYIDGRYKFLPKTALVLDAKFNSRSFFSGQPTAMLLHATAGLSGLVTPKVSVVAKAGWAHNFTGEGRTVVGQLELAYLPSQTASVRLGYLRTIEPIGVYGMFGDDRGYIEGQALLGGRMTLRGYASLDLLTFYGTETTPGRSDVGVTLGFGPEYQFTRWLTGAVGYALNMRASSSPGFGYTRNEGYLRLTASY